MIVMAVTYINILAPWLNENYHPRCEDPPVRGQRGLGWRVDLHLDGRAAARGGDPRVCFALGVMGTQNTLINSRVLVSTLVE